MLKVYHCIYRHCGEEWGVFDNRLEAECPICGAKVRPVFSEIRYIKDGKLMEVENA